MRFRVKTVLVQIAVIMAVGGTVLSLAPDLSYAETAPSAEIPPAISESSRDTISTAAPVPIKTKPKTVGFEAKVGSWLSTGETQWSHNASSLSSLVGNPTSKLTYKDVGTNIVEFGGKLTVLERAFLRADYGFGGIGGGRLTDDDYLSAAGATFYGTATPGAQLVSRTHSDINGNDVRYLNIDLGFTFYQFPNGKGSLSTFFGYQNWREAQSASGVTQVICTAVGTFCRAPGTVTNSGRTVISNTTSWNSLKVGVEGDYNVWSRVTLGGKVAFIPYASLENRDIHHLRTDLAQNPSFKMTGNGLGVNAEGTVSVRLVSTLFLDLGYRFWYLSVSDGTWQSFSRTGAVSTAQLKELSTMRQGATLGLRYTF